MLTADNELTGKSRPEYKKRNWAIGYTLALLCLWSVFVVLAGLWEAEENRIKTVNFAHYQALAAFQTASLHGRQPTDTKQEKSEYGHTVRLVSFDPAAENKPDEWEAQAMRSLESKNDEVSSLETIDGKPYLRFIKACPAKTDFPSGERAQAIAAAVSIAVPMEPLWTISRYEIDNLVMGYAAAWCAGALVILLGHLYLKRHRKKHLQYEEQLVEQIEQAKNETVRKSGFLANMSHEIRTPMNSIIGFTELLIDEELTDEQKDYLKTVQSSGRGLLELINDILDISKIESGKLKIVKTQFSIQTLIDDVRSLMRPTIESKGLSFRLQKSMGTPNIIYTDALRLKQCLINLINNALKFTGKGSITLCVSVYLEKKQQWLRFDVRDTGIGIPPDKQKEVFREFVQAEDATAHKYGGTGLGLCITQQLTEMLGGRITLQSQVGEGTTFSIHLPVEEPAAKQETPPQQVTSTPPSLP